MKKLFLSFFAFTLLVFTSCDHDTGDVKFDGESLLHFPAEDQSIAFVLSTDEFRTFDIPFGVVKKVSGSHVVNLIVDLENSDAVQGVDFEIVDNSVELSNGDIFSAFQVRVFGSTITEDGKIVRFNLDSPTLSPAVFRDTYTLILKEECSTNFDLWFGNLNIEDVGYGVTPGTGSGTPTGTCNTVVVNNNLPGMPASTNNRYEIVLEPSSPGATSGTATVEETVSRTGLTAGGQPVNAVYIGSGTYNEETKTITLQYQVLAKSTANGQIVGTYWTGTNIIVKP